MNATKTILEVWSPETSEDRLAVLFELQCVLASPHFCNSKRYPALLRYIVERMLEGKADELKERTLGIEVFHRPSDYDTNADTVVRYTAGEVRKRLSLYYHQHEASSGFQISLPVGSYVPEFLREHEGELPGASGVGLARTAAYPVHSMEPVFPAVVLPAIAQDAAPRASRMYLVAAGVVLVALLGAWGTMRFARRGQNVEDEFWAPVFHEQGSTLICTGGNVFAEKNFSGTMTAGKDTEYPFVSMQIAAGMARVSGVLVRAGVKYQIQSSATTPLTDLRERSVVLVGGYNNEWTMRLLQPLRYHFLNEPLEGIVDRDQPGRTWRRDRSQPYASTDDYALIARFRDPTTGSTVVALAGLGRNGSEAAAQFATSSYYMQILRDRLGKNLGSGNMEVVLKISVIGGKTGAPTIEDVAVW